MHNTLPMRLVLPITLLLAASTWLALPARSQTTLADADIPRISRTCLWNADRDTWKKLHLKRKQVLRMNDIRSRYPAVVEGQWIISEQTEAIDMGYTVATADSTNPVDFSSSNGSPAHGSTGQPAGTPSGSGLQAELRSVLTAKQLMTWKRLCSK